MLVCVTVKAPEQLLYQHRFYSVTSENSDQKFYGSNCNAILVIDGEDHTPPYP